MKVSSPIYRWLVFTYSNGSIFGIFAPKGSGIESVADLNGENIGISEPGGRLGRLP